MRGRQAPKRHIRPDEVYGSELVTKLINYVMKDGKKTVASKNVYEALELAASKTKQNAVEVLEDALKNLKPKVEVRSKRIGGANFQVPVPVSEKRQVALAYRWLVDAARNGRGKGSFAEALSRELVNSVNKEGSAYKKKEEVLRMAEANKAFTQFA